MRKRISPLISMSVLVIMIGAIFLAGKPESSSGQRMSEIPPNRKPACTIFCGDGTMKYVVLAKTPKCWGGPLPADNAGDYFKDVSKEDKSAICQNLKAAGKKDTSCPVFKTLMAACDPKERTEDCRRCEWNCVQQANQAFPGQDDASTRKWLSFFEQCKNLDCSRVCNYPSSRPPEPPRDRSEGCRKCEWNCVQQANQAFPGMDDASTRKWLSFFEQCKNLDCSRACNYLPSPESEPRENPRADSHLKPEHREAVQQWLGQRPHLRLAIDGDCVCKSHLTSERSSFVDYHPYYRTADFNGDKTDDFAIVLVNTQKRAAKFSIAVFNGPIRKDSKAAFFREGLDLRRMAFTAAQGLIDARRTTLFVQNPNTGKGLMLSLGRKGYFLEPSQEDFN